MEDIISCCGYLCSQCPAYKDNAVSDSSRELTSYFWLKFFDYSVPPDEIYCDGCISADSGNPILLTKNCPIRNCVTQKKLENCGGCKDYLCEMKENQTSDFEKIEEKFKDKIPNSEYLQFFSPYNSRKILVSESKKIKD